MIDDRLMCEKLAVFPGISLNPVSNSLFYDVDVVRFKIEVGVDAKCMCKNVTLNTRELPAIAAA